MIDQELETHIQRQTFTEVIGQLMNSIECK